MELFFGSEQEMYFMISDRLNGLIHYPIMVLDVRLDYGFGKGQSGFLFNINEAF